QLNEQEKEELAMSEAAIRDAYAATGTFFKNPEETLRYVNRQMAIMDYNSSINAAEARGEKRGEARGEKRGEERMANLMQRLYAEGRNDDAIKAASDKTYRQKLYQELHI
ncbi:MAG: transposase, partial [Veillonellaceae bacterium]|nr:transposase [Veillonellaceae bacterium]MDD6924099.1 transposase [Veillonellaceae bacterium]